MTIYRPSLRRRTLLRSLGLGAAAAYLAPHRVAFSQASAPKRLLILWGSTGCVPGRWEPRGEGGGAPSEHAWRLGSSMEALAPYQDRMLVFRNLDMLSALGSARRAVAGHDGGRVNSLVAQRGTVRPDDALGISIDQLISQQLSADGPVTRVSNIVAARDRPWSSSSWLGPGRQVAAMSDLRALYDLLFPDALRPDPAAPEPTTEPDTSAARNARVMSLIRSDHEEFARRLPALHRQRLEAHMDQRTRLEAALELGRGGGGAIRPPADAWPDRSLLDRLPERGGPSNDLRTELGIEMSVAAFHADITRIATVSIDDSAPPGPDYDRYRESGQSDVDVMHALQHEFGKPEVSNEEASDVLEASYRVAMGHVQKAADLLAERRDADGSSLLDSTLIVFCPHIARGEHTVFDLPMFTLGNLQGYFRTGRFIDFALDADGFGRAHGDLWTSVANGMDVPIDSFGLRSRGAISELT